MRIREASHGEPAEGVPIPYGERMRTGLAQKFLLAGLALSSTFVGLEFAVRAFRFAPDIGIIELNTPHATYRAVANPILKFVPKPNTGDINEHGLRDHSYAIEKPPGTFRILVLGDSIGFGFCTQDASIPLDSIFAKVLERRLNARSDLGSERFEIINFSVTGYDTRQEVEFLATKGIAFSPRSRDRRRIDRAFRPRGRSARGEVEPHPVISATCRSVSAASGPTCRKTCRGRSDTRSASSGGRRIRDGPLRHLPSGEGYSPQREVCPVTGKGPHDSSPWNGLTV